MTGQSIWVRGRRIAAVTIAAGFAVGGVAWASIPTSGTGVITGCYKTAAPNQGALRVIDAQAGAVCWGDETRLTWNQRGINWKGAWSAAASYAKNDAVVSDGTSFIALVPNVNVTPPNAANWAVLAQRGAEGPVGARGATGPAGPSNIITIAQSIQGVVAIPALETPTWQFLGNPVPIDVIGGDTLDVEGVFVGATRDGGGDYFESGICYRSRGATQLGSPIGQQFVDVGDADAINAAAARVLHFPSTRSIDVGYCARFWSEDSGWYRNNVILTIRHLRGVTFRQL